MFEFFIFTLLLGLGRGCSLSSHLGYNVSEVRPHFGLVHPDALFWFDFGLVSFCSLGPSFNEGLPYVGQKFFPLFKVCAFCKAVDEVLHPEGVHGLFIVFRLGRRPRLARSFFDLSFDDIVEPVNHRLYNFFIWLFQFMQGFDDCLFVQEAVDDIGVPLRVDHVCLVSLLVGLNKGRFGALLGGRLGSLRG